MENACKRLLKPFPLFYPFVFSPAFLCSYALRVFGTISFRSTYPFSLSFYSLLLFCALSPPLLYYHGQSSSVLFERCVDICYMSILLFALLFNLLFLFALFQVNFSLLTFYTQLSFTLVMPFLLCSTLH